MSTPKLARRTVGTLVLTLLGSSNFVFAGNTTCAGNLTDWYTNTVGETACETYQRLRQICNPQYRVPSFRPTTPGDQCDDQLTDCCCNSISWGLSMLCMNCQWDVIGGPSIGIDAVVGAYGTYRSPNGQFCSPGTNWTLPTDIQTAACNEKINLPNFLYNTFWANDAWYFVYTMDRAGVFQAENDIFYQCNSTNSTASTAPLAPGPSGTVITSFVTVIPTATGNPSVSASHTNTATVAGGVVGGVGGAAMIFAAGLLWRRRRQQRLPKSEPPMTTIAPFTATAASLDRGQSLQGSPGFSPLRQPTYKSLSFSTDRAPSDGGPSRSAVGIARAPANHLVLEEDMGPAGTPDRSVAGSLPPAYNSRWHPSQPPSQSSR